MLPFFGQAKKGRRPAGQDRRSVTHVRGLRCYRAIVHDATKNPPHGKKPAAVLNSPLTLALSHRGEREYKLPSLRWEGSGEGERSDYFLALALTTGFFFAAVAPLAAPFLAGAATLAALAAGSTSCKR